MSSRGASVPSTVDLQQRITAIYDHLYANAPTRTPAGIGTEVGKILHAAMFAEEREGHIPAFQLSKSEVKSISNGGGLFTAGMVKSVRQWFSKMNSQWLLYDIGDDIRLSDFDILFICGQLSGISISDRNRDVFGDALEIFRGQWAKRIGGQFFTDQRVTSLAMTLLEYDPRKGDDLIDICAGTGGFLLAAVNKIEQLLASGGALAADEATMVSLAMKSIKGQEVDVEVGEIANATLVARLGEHAGQRVTYGDSLRPGNFGTNHPTGIEFDTHLCLASNPPFGSKITVKDPSILVQFDLAKISSRGNVKEKRLIPRAPDTLFLEQNIRLLKPGIGRLAIVLPYQILSGPQASFIREWLLQQAQLIAVIDLPADTFQPHTGTKAALVVARRRKEPTRELHLAADPPIFASMPRWIGHDRRGNSVFERTADGKLTDRVLSDFEEIHEAFHHFQQGQNPNKVHSRSFIMDPRSIAADPSLRFNALYHQPRKDQPTNLHPHAHETLWNFVKLRSVVARIFYPGRFKRHYVDRSPTTVPFLGGSNIPQLHVRAEKWLDAQNPMLDALRVCAGWLLLTRSGSTGIVSSVPIAWDGYAMSEHVIRIVPDSTKLDPLYIQAYLRTVQGQQQIARGVFGSVIDEITPEFVGDLMIPIPRSQEVLQQIIDRLRLAEEARQLAIENTAIAVTDLEAQLPSLN